MKSDSEREVVIFTEALKVPPEDHHDFLARKCGDDKELRRKLEGLLRAHERLGNFLEEPPTEGLSELKGLKMKKMPWERARYAEAKERSFGKEGGVTVTLESYENGDGGVSENQISLFPQNRRSADMKGSATVMLAAIAEGDRGATEELLVLVYDELRRLAASKLAQEAPGQTLQPTALVHEAWLRLVGDRSPSFNDRTHFFRASAEAMRRILIDRARRKKTQRHGGGFQRIGFDFDQFDLAAPSADDQLLAMNEALDRFAVEHPVQADLVKLRYFAGLTNEEVAEVLGVSLSTVKNYWAFSRAWLLSEVEGEIQS